jgi:hemerythrin
LNNSISSWTNAAKKPQFHGRKAGNYNGKLQGLADFGPEAGGRVVEQVLSPCQGVIMDYQVVQLDSRYSVGIEAIDEQHKQLISMCHILHLNHQKKDEISRDFFRNCVSSLVNFLQYHFFSEEQLLSRIAYPEFRTHQEEHKKAIEFLNRHLMYLGTSEEARIKESIPLFYTLLLNHITVCDRRYAAYVHTMNRYTPWHIKDSGLPPEMFLG